MNDAPLRGTHRLLAQWVSIVQICPDGVIVQYEDGSISRQPIAVTEIIEVMDRK